MLIVSPFNDKTTRLNQRLTICERKGFHAGDGGFRNGKLSPSMARDTSTGG
jgi:hypothetical protein